MRRLVAAPLCAALAACSTLGGPEIPSVVEVPVPVGCVTSVPERPRFWTDEEYLRADRYQATLRLWYERRARDRYIADLEAIVAGCSARGEGASPK